MRIWRRNVPESGIDSDASQSNRAGLVFARVCVSGSLLVAGCTATRPLSMGLDHPANPQAKQLPPPPELRETLGPDAQTQRTHELINRRAANLDGAHPPRPDSSEPAPGHEHAHEH